MEFVETPTFSRRLVVLLDDEAYRALQQELQENPRRGAVIRGTGGARKIRWAPSGRGKSGGVRVIYYDSPAPGRCYMLFIFAKNEQSDPTSEQRSLLRAYIQQHLK